MTFVYIKIPKTVSGSRKIIVELQKKRNKANRLDSLIWISNLNNRLTDVNP